MEAFMWSIFFGIIGFGFFSYGKSQDRMITMFTGGALMFFPYFVSDPYITAGIGFGLMAVPWAATRI